ncbi:MAG: hypothetical protein AAF927_16570 [Bacteroidota bacterium]
MALIIIVGRYISNLQAIQDSVSDSLSKHCLCIEEKGLFKDKTQLLAAYPRPQTAIFDLTNYPEGASLVLQAFHTVCPEEVHKIIVHPYQGGLLDSLKERFSAMQFVHLEEVSDRLGPMLENKLLFSKTLSK